MSKPTYVEIWSSSLLPSREMKSACPMGRSEPKAQAGPVGLTPSMAAWSSSSRGPGCSVQPESDHRPLNKAW